MKLLGCLILTVPVVLLKRNQGSHDILAGGWPSRRVCGGKTRGSSEVTCSASCLVKRRLQEDQTSAAVPMREQGICDFSWAAACCDARQPECVFNRFFRPRRFGRDCFLGGDLGGGEAQGARDGRCTRHEHQELMKVGSAHVVSVESEETRRGSACSCASQLPSA